MQNFVDDAGGDGDQDQVSAGLLPLIAVIVRQPAEHPAIEFFAMPGGSGLPRARFFWIPGGRAGPGDQ